MKKTFTKSLLLIVAMTMGINAWAEDLTYTLNPSKDGYFRSGNSTNFATKGIMELNTHASTTWLSLIGFNLSEVKSKLDEGYKVKSVNLRLTRISGAASVADIYGYNSEDWTEGKWDSNNNTSLSQSNFTSSTIYSFTHASVDGGTDCYGYATKHLNTPASDFSIATYQESTGALSSGEFFKYVKAAVNNGSVSFALDKAANGNASKFWTREPANYTDNLTNGNYEWNGSAWTLNSTTPNIGRYAITCRYFQGSMTEDEFKKELMPQLTIVLEECPTTTVILPAQTTSKDISFRSGNTSNYWTSGTIHMNQAGSTFSGVMSFDMSTVNEYRKMGYEIKNVKLTITNYSSYNNSEVDIRPWTTAYEENDTYTYAGVTAAVINAAQAKAVITSFKLVNPKGKDLPFICQVSGCPEVSSLADYQTTINADAFTNYFKACTADECSFMLTNTERTNEVQIFTKDCSHSGFNTPNKSTMVQYTWNGSAWVEGSETIERYVQMLTNFGYNASDANSCNAFQAAVAPKLEITMELPNYELDVTSASAATLILPYNTTIPTGASCYTLNYTGGNTVTATPVETTLPANTPVYVKAAEGKYTFAPAEGASGLGDGTAKTVGALTGVYAITNVPADSYILYNGTSGVGFYKSNSSTVAPYHAYLTAEASSAKSITIVFDDEPTGINEVADNNTSGAIKFVKNGQLLIKTANGTFNAAGQLIK